jgi:hypothetical protein
MVSQLIKVDMLDATLADEEATQVVLNIFYKVFGPETVAKYQLELKTIFNFLYYRFTTLRDKQTVGLELENLRFKFRSKSQKIKLLLLTVFVPYFFEKL